MLLILSIFSFSTIAWTSTDEMEDDPEDLDLLNFPFLPLIPTININVRQINHCQILDMGHNCSGNFFRILVTSVGMSDQKRFQSSLLSESAIEFFFD